MVTVPLRGTFKDGQGKPLGNERVTVSLGGSPVTTYADRAGLFPQSSASILTASDGSFRTHVASAGTYTATITDQVAGTVTLTLSASADPDDRPSAGGLGGQAQSLASTVYSGVYYLAHRGGGSAQGGGYYEGPYPEETMEAYRAAVAAGATALGLHVRATADGAVVCLHDATPDRTTNATGSIPITRYTTGAVKALRVTPDNATLWPGYGQSWGTQVQVPFLAAVLDEFGGKVHLDIEVNSGDWQATGYVGQLVTNMVVARGLQKYVTVRSFKAGELPVVAAAGIWTCYLPPDLGTAGSDLASIQTATAGAYVSGQPKLLGVNAFPAGQTQAQVTTWIQQLVAAGFSLSAWMVERRYDRDWLRAAGVTGFTTDEPIYLPAMSAPMGVASQDPHAFGTWGHGMQLADQGRGRGNLHSGGIQMDFASSGTQYVLFGAYCPVKTPTSYTLSADIVLDQIDSDPSRHAELYFACPDDRPTTATASTGAYGYVDGYILGIRENGGLLFSRTTQSSQGVANPSATSGPTSFLPTVTLSAALTQGTSYSSLAVTALASAIPAGCQVILNPNTANAQIVTVSGAVASGATSIPVTTFTAGAAVATGAATVVFGTGMVIRLAVAVAASTITVTVSINGVAQTPTIYTDSTFRGGYFHIGKSGIGAVQKLLCTFKNVTVQ